MGSNVQPLSSFVTVMVFVIRYKRPSSASDLLPPTLPNIISPGLVSSLIVWRLRKADHEPTNVYLAWLTQKRTVRALPRLTSLISPSKSQLTGGNVGEYARQLTKYTAPPVHSWADKAHDTDPYHDSSAHFLSDTRLYLAPAENKQHAPHNSENI